MNFIGDGMSKRSYFSFLVLSLLGLEKLVKSAS